MPAQLTAMRRSRDAATAARASSSLVTSPGTNVAAAPSSRATSAPADAGRSKMTTRAPRSSSSSAVARPRPDAPPVTSALVPAISTAGKDRAASAGRDDLQGHVVGRPGHAAERPDAPAGRAQALDDRED